MAFRKKTTPTLQERLNATAATKAAALSVFAAAADDLEAAAIEAEEVRSSANQEANWLDQIAVAARQEAHEARTKATLIRESFLG